MGRDGEKYANWGGGGMFLIASFDRVSEYGLRSKDGLGTPLLGKRQGRGK